MTKAKDWFASWFDTSYYHVLYKHRDFSEGRHFMEHLTSYLKITYEDLVLDLACGKGRHAIFLNAMGFRVVGADLAANNIIHARQFANDRLRFVQHDMRKPLKNKYDFVFNLFTSFGFFEADGEDIAIMKHIKNGLQPGGKAVIDFMNVHKAVRELVTEEDLEIEGIRFYIKRYLEDGFIVKEINVEDGATRHQFFEKVKFLDLDKFKSFCELANLTIIDLFGSYDLEPFDVHDSDRLILIMK